MEMFSLWKGENKIEEIMETITKIDLARAYAGIVFIGAWITWCAMNNYLIPSNIDKFIFTLGGIIK